MIHNINTSGSSLIEDVYYDDQNSDLTIVFKKYYTNQLVYENVSIKLFQAFAEVKSVGKYYLHFIKQYCQLKNTHMADKPKTVNKSSTTEKRYIKLSIDTKKINKDWIIVGEKGAYLNVTLALLPENDMDRYGNLGMITQDVPKSVYEKEAKLPKDKRTQGAILGNGAEFERKDFSSEGAPGNTSGNLADDDDKEDLPF